MGERSDKQWGARWGLARGTPSWVVPLWAVAAAALAAGGRRPGLVLATAAAVTSAFFRDPNRTSAGDGILAPADGIVSRVDRAADGRARVATFMAVWDVHVNRAPIDGTVRSQVHRPGGKRPAFHKDSHLNERLEWVIDTPQGEVGLTQIAGAFARRIVPYVGAGEQISRGGRIGLIRFGSRVDVVLPEGAEAGVRVGRRVRAGITRLDLAASRLDLGTASH